MKIISKYIDCIKEVVDFRLGQNANDNFDIIDAALPDDIWFHIEGRPSLHVIVTIPERANKKQIARIITQGACICKQNSKYASEKNVAIVYANVQDISKTSIPGSVHLEKSKTITI